MGYVKGNLQAMHEAAEDGEVTTNTTLESSRDEVSTLEELVTAFEGQEQTAVKQMSDAHDHADQQLLSPAADTEAAISELQEERGRLRGFAPGAIGEAKRLQSSLWTNLTLQLDDTAQQLQCMRNVFGISGRSDRAWTDGSRSSESGTSADYQLRL